MAFTQAGNEEQRGAVITAVAALTATVAAGATPTKAEHDALLVDVTALRVKLNELMTNLRNTNTVD